MADKPGGRSARLSVLSLGAVFMAAGASLCYFGYAWGFVAVNPDELLGSVLFWCGVVALLLAFPLRRALAAFGRYVTKPLGAAVFALYLAVHLLLYGFLLDGIFTSIYGSSYFSVPAGLLLATNTFYPTSLSSTGFDLAYNPSLVLTVPPIFSAALSAYSVAVAVVIAVLIVGSVGETRLLGELCTRGGRARSYVVLPAVGIVFGASCCLSVAGLVSLAAPSVSQLSSVVWVYYATYFLFPALAIVLLYTNMRAIEKVSARVRASLPA